MEHLSVPGLLQESHFEKANASQSPTEWSTSSSSIHLGTLNPQVQRLDDQPDYPYPESFPPVEVSSPVLASSSTIPNPLQSSPPLEFAHPAERDHGEQPELPAPEGLHSEVSAEESVPLSLALRQLELWDDVPPDFPQQVALFLAQGAGQESQAKPGPEISVNRGEEAFTDLKRIGNE